MYPPQKGVLTEVWQDPSDDIASMKTLVQTLERPFDEMYAVEMEIYAYKDTCRVQKVRCSETGGFYVVKKQTKKRGRARGERRFRRRTECLMNIPATENIVKILACYEDETYFYTILEWLQGGDLFDFMLVLHPCNSSDTCDAISPELLQIIVHHIMIQVLRALRRLHAQGLIH